MTSALFPHAQVRDGQDRLMRAIATCIESGTQLVAHAPTGLGKTAAALAPAIEKAIAGGKTVVFLTSRLTQHTLALETVRKIGERSGTPIPAVDLVGKRHLCLQEGIDALPGREFAEHCKRLREENACAYYERLRTGETQSAAARSALIQIGQRPGSTPAQVLTVCAAPEHQVCPYEVTMLLAKEARVIVTDYTYLFNAAIREGFLRRIGKQLDDLILIVDEGHNLPDRIKDLATVRLTTRMLARAVRELERNERPERARHVRAIGEAIAGFAHDVRDERLIGRDELLDAIERICPFDPLIDDLEAVAQLVREERRSSSCGALSTFLNAWIGGDDGYVRILSVARNPYAHRADARAQEEGDREEQEDAAPPDTSDTHPLFRHERRAVPPGRETARWPDAEIRYRCLDPGVLTGPVLRGAHASVLMSGTLTPTAMYTRLLGIPDAGTMELTSPFPRRNRINLIVPKTTTKFTTRSTGMYDAIAAACVEIINAVPGNSAVFVPSYALLAELRPRIDHASEKTVLAEDPSCTREEREELLTRFRAYKGVGAALLGVMSGSFSEGIDLPGDELRAVIVVGLPLARPDLETKATIDRYEQAFGKGWDYGYTFPAFNKTLQTAGRCIRTEHDRGAIIFLDERYAWASYRACFPTEWEMRTTLDPVALVRQFFSIPPEDEIDADQAE